MKSTLYKILPILYSRRYRVRPEYKDQKPPIRQKSIQPQKNITCSLKTGSAAGRMQASAKNRRSSRPPHTPHANTTLPACPCIAASPTKGEDATCRIWRHLFTTGSVKPHDTYPRHTTEKTGTPAEARTSEPPNNSQGRKRKRSRRLRGAAERD